MPNCHPKLKLGIRGSSSGKNRTKHTDFLKSQFKKQPRLEIKTIIKNQIMKNLITLLILLTNLATHAQTLNLQEAAKVQYNNIVGSSSGAYYVITNGFALDNEGNRYVTGRYRGDFDFDPDPAVVSRPTGSNYDLFAMKLSKNDELIWVKFWGVATNNEEEMLTVAVDNNKNVIITGQFREAMDFDPDDGTFNMSNGAVTAGYKSLFMLKLNAAGDFLWAKNFQASAANTMLFRNLSMNCDANNNILTTGYFSGTVDFDPNAGSAVTTAITAEGGTYDAFLLKMDTDGNYVFSYQLGFNWQYEFGYEAVADAVGNVYVLFGGRNFDNSQSRSQVNKYSPTGSLIWTYTKNTAGYIKMALDAAGNAFMSTENNVIKIAGSNGAELWIKPIIGSNISIDKENNIIKSGNFSFNEDFDPSPTSSYIINRTGNFDGFISKMDNNGNFIWAKNFAGATSSSINIIRQSINQNNEIWLWGYYLNSIDVDPGAGSVLYTSTTTTGSNATDGWVGKYCDCTLELGLPEDDKLRNYHISPNLGEQQVLSTDGYTLAKLTPNGANPLNGMVEVRVNRFSEDTYYVRAYQIYPSQNAANSTARVTLYYTQVEFDNNNTYNPIKLPTGPIDTPGISNIRLLKYNGYTPHVIAAQNYGAQTPTEIRPDAIWNVTKNRWELSFNVTSFSGFFMSPAVPAALPLNLLSFTAKSQENTIQLNWRTANETNFSHFEIQKSNDAKEFGAIGKVDGNKTEYYNFTDINPNEGQNYYKLKMVDLDGTSYFSKTISINFHKNGNYLLVENPANYGEFVVKSNYASPSFSIVNGLGKKVEMNIYKMDENQYKLSTKNKTTGIYFLMMESQGVVITRKLILE